MTAGGLLWRRRAGEFYVCLVASPDRRFCEIPRGPVLEGERPSDAAARIVRSVTGFFGKPEKPLARAVSANGEIACLFLLQCSGDPSFESAARTMTARWVPIERAFDLLATSAERNVVRRAATALTQPIGTELLSDECMPMRRAGEITGR